MSKKIISLPGHNSEGYVLGYRLPQFHSTGKRKYVDFYAYDPALGRMRRKKIHLDKYKTNVERQIHASLLIATLTQKLISGWNPWVSDTSTRALIELRECADRYLETISKKNREKTIDNYQSKLNVMFEYNAQRFQPIKYAYEFDRAFVVDFLDWILVDRDRGPRTRNNYRGWCFSFGEFLKDRKYIDENPAAGIQKISESKKYREPLSNSMMSQLKRHLKDSDPWFYLAVMMEYYTFIRPRELTFIRIADISIKNQSVFIPASVSKNKHDGYVGLNRILIRQMIKLNIFDSPDDYYLFGKGFRPSKHRISPDAFNKRWASMRRQLRWSDRYQFYSLKDTGIRDLANKSGIVVARDQARHRDISTTNKYLGKSDSVNPETIIFSGALDDED